MFCLFPYTTPTYEVPRRARPTSSETLAPPRARFLDTQHRVSPEALPSPHSPVTKRILRVRLTDGSEVPILGNPSRPLPLPSKQYPFMLLLCDRRYHVFKELWLLKKKKKEEDKEELPLVSSSCFFLPTGFTFLPREETARSGHLLEKVGRKNVVGK